MGDSVYLYTVPQARQEWNKFPNSSVEDEAKIDVTVFSQELSHKRDENKKLLEALSSNLGIHIRARKIELAKEAKDAKEAKEAEAIAAIVTEQQIVAAAEQLLLNLGQTEYHSGNVNHLVQGLRSLAMMLDVPGSKDSFFAGLSKVNLTGSSSTLEGVAQLVQSYNDNMLRVEGMCRRVDAKADVSRNIAKALTGLSLALLATFTVAAAVVTFGSSIVLGAAVSKIAAAIILKWKIFALTQAATYVTASAAYANSETNRNKAQALKLYNRTTLNDASKGLRQATEQKVDAQLELIASQDNVTEKGKKELKRSALLKMKPQS